MPACPHSMTLPNFESRNMDAVVDLADVVRHHMEPFAVTAGCDRGEGLGRVGLRVNRPGRTFISPDERGKVRVVSTGDGQQWIAKVMSPDQAAFEAARFERIRRRAGPDIVPVAVGTISLSPTTSALVQVRSAGTAGDLVRLVDGLWFAEDWNLWASFDAFMRIHRPRVRRAATLALYRDDAFAVRNDSSAEAFSFLQDEDDGGCGVLAPSVRDGCLPSEWLGRLPAEAASETVSAAFESATAAALEIFIAGTPGLREKLAACAEARHAVRSAAYGACLVALRLAGIAQADYAKLDNYACDWRTVSDDRRQEMMMPLISLPDGSRLQFDVRMLDMGETIDVDALAEHHHRVVSKMIWGTRYGVVAKPTPTQVLGHRGGRCTPSLSQ